MTRKADLASMLETLVAIALRAGEEILHIYESADLGERIKADGSPVTQADAAAEVIILEALARHWPDIPVVAEESVCAGEIPTVGVRFFLVDPLDGTAEFVQRSGEFTVNIALIEEGRPTVGVIYLPVTGEVFRGSPDGAERADFVKGEPLVWTKIRARGVPAQGLSVIASRRSRSVGLEDYLARLPVAETVRASSSLKLCRLAEGKADLYPRFGRTMAWDIAAGDAILRAAGGCVWTFDGEPLTYGPNRVPDDEMFANPYFVASGAFDPSDLVTGDAPS